MESRVLIDAIMRQTTLLIAQLATSTGIRAPLANLADQVFLELSAQQSRSQTEYSRYSVLPTEMVRGRLR